MWMEADSSRWGRWKPPAEGGKEISHMRVENEDLFLFPQCRRCQGPTDMGGTQPRHQAGFMEEGTLTKHSDVWNVGNGSRRKQP